MRVGILSYPKYRQNILQNEKIILPPDGNIFDPPGVIIMEKEKPYRLQIRKEVTMYTAIALTRYGSLEIKRAYRKNMTTGIIIAAMIMISCLAAYHIMANTAVDDTAIRLTLPPDSVFVINYPIPRIYEIPQPTQSSLAKPIPTAGIPTPVPDNEADDNATLPTVDDLTTLINRNMPKNIGELDPNLVVIANPEEVIPDPGVFIPVDEMPQAIESVAPMYPEMARIAGVQGEVWVKAYIDKNGNVLNAFIYKDSGAKAGFEEAAITAAKASSWKPAISNGQPVGVWICYKIEFKLK
jgi:TonB family protein